MSKVYFAHNLENLPELIEKYDLLTGFSEPVGVKVHFGEKGNETFISAKRIAEVVKLVKNPTLVECNVLYKSDRSKASSHIKLAKEHGFDFAPIDILDGEEGDEEIELDIDSGKHFKKARIGRGIEKYKSLLVVSHFKGHGANGFGGANKNVGMGLASRAGKLALHASIKHNIDTDKCISCGNCINNCPVGAIDYNDNGKAIIDEDKCISCSKCISACNFGAVEIPWGSTNKEVLQERIVEYTQAVVKNKKCLYINFLENITSKCDCIGESMELMTSDIGILVSADPVAIDQASYDLITKKCPEFTNLGGTRQLEYGEEFGLGSRKYSLH